MENLIGNKYKYPEPNSETIFVLKNITKSRYEFECGHWVTDTVFMDLINIETGLQNYEIMEHTVTDESRLILSGNVVIEGMTHKVENKYIKCNTSLNSKSWNTTKSESIFEKCFKKHLMYELKKTKQFQPSDNTIEVDFDGITTDCTNLLKSGLTNNTVVLVGYNKEWHEVSVSSLLVTTQEGPNKFTFHECKTSNLDEFKKHVEKHKISLLHLGIIKQEKNDYNYMDYISISKMFPEFTYLDVEKLHKYIKSEQLPSSRQDIISTAKFMVFKKFTVNDYIAHLELQKHEIIKTNTNMKTVLTPEELAQRKITRVNDLNSLGMEFDEFEGTFNGFGFTITSDSIEEDNDKDWSELFLKIRNASFKMAGENKGYSATEVLETVNDAVSANSVAEISEPSKTELITLDTIGNLQPERISELQGLSEKQDAVVKANPFVKITDAKTLKKAKAAKSALLKASTETEGIEKNASKYLNTFKAMIKRIVEPAAQKTRDALKLQADEITEYENAEELRIQAEQREKLEKIKARTTRLFAVPFVFNGSLYQIGTLYVTPSQVETSTDEEFDALVKQGEVIQESIEAAAKAESEKDKMIADLKKQQDELLAKLVALTNPVPEPVAPPAPTPAPTPVASARKSVDVSETANDTVIEPAAPVAHEVPVAHEAPVAPVNKAPATNNERVSLKYTPETDYELPAPGNTILNRFDAEYLEHVQANPIPLGFIKSRGWMKHGTRLLADEILAIMANPDPSVKKAPLIVELCTIIKNDI